MPILEQLAAVVLVSEGRDCRSALRNGAGAGQGDRV